MRPGAKKGKVRALACDGQEGVWALLETLSGDCDRGFRRVCHVPAVSQAIPLV